MQNPKHNPQPEDMAMSAQSLMQLYDEAFVRAAYLRILRRPADSTGIELYRGHLRSGLSRVECLAALASSDEAKQRGPLSADLADLIAKSAPKKEKNNAWMNPFRPRNIGFEKEVLRRLNVLENLLGALLTSQTAYEEPQQPPRALPKATAAEPTLNEVRTQDPPIFPDDLIERARRRLNHFSAR